MASIKERTSKTGKSFYQAQIRRRGYPTVSKTFSKRQDAQDWATLTEGAILRNETVNPKEAASWTIPQIIDWYKQNPNPRRVYATKKHEQRLDLLAAEFNSFTAASLTPAILQKWIQRRLEFNAPSTVYHYYVALKNALTYHATQHHYAQRIFELVKCPTKSGERTERFSEEEVEALFAAVDRHAKVKQQEFRWCVLFALETALRIGEQLQLKWRNVDLEKRQLDVLAETTKTRTLRRIPLTTPAVEILKTIKGKYGSKPNDRIFGFYHLNEHHLSRQFKIACRWVLKDELEELMNEGRAEAPLKAMTLADTPEKEELRAAAEAKARKVARFLSMENKVYHTLRHEATSRFFEKTTLTDVEVATITGHRTLNMLQKYTHLRPSSILHKLW